MKFALNHAPDVVNLHIDVTVAAAEHQNLAQVSTSLDSVNLATDSLPAATVQYEKTFSRGGCGPGFLPRDVFCSVEYFVAYHARLPLK